MAATSAGEFLDEFIESHAYLFNELGLYLGGWFGCWGVDERTDME